MLHKQMCTSNLIRWASLSLDGRSGVILSHVCLEFVLVGGCRGFPLRLLGGSVVVVREQF